MSGDILSRFRRKPASVSELIARSRATAAPTPAVAPTPAPRRPSPVALAMVAATLALFVAGAWGVAQFGVAPHEVEASSGPEAPPRAPATITRASADRTRAAPQAAPLAPPSYRLSAPAPDPQPLSAASVVAPPAAEALEGAPTGAARGAIVDIVSQGEPLRLRVLAGAEARSLSNGRGAQGLQVVEADAGNHLDVRNGDVIYDLCDRAGEQSAAQIVAALTAPVAPTCVAFVRGAAAPDPLASRD